jgi:ketosteroid isomerase-like protein
MTTEGKSDREATEELVRRYYSVVSDLSSTAEDLAPLLAADLTVIEHPNALIPAGAQRNLEQTLEGFRRGKALLREQDFTVHDVIVDGNHAAARATWRGMIGTQAGPFHDGQELVAHVAAILTISGGVITRHETFDCYEPFDVSSEGREDRP